MRVYAIAALFQLVHTIIDLAEELLLVNFNDVHVRYIIMYVHEHASIKKTLDTIEQAFPNRMQM